MLLALKQPTVTGLACVRRNPFIIISICLSLSHTAWRNENEFNVNIKASFGRASFAFYNELKVYPGKRVLSPPSIRVDEGEARVVG